MNLRKILIAITLLLTIPFMTLIGQNFEIEDGSIMYKEVLRPCISVSVDPEEKTLKNAWQDYMKDNYDLKLRGRNVLAAEEVKIQQISSNTLNIYTIIEEDKNGSAMKVFASKGYDINIDLKSYPKEYNAIKDIVENFLKQSLPNYYNQMVVDTEERIQELVEDRRNIEQDLKKEGEKLEALKIEIEETQDELMQKEVRLLEAKEKLEMRIEKLDRIRVQLQKL